MVDDAVTHLPRQIEPLATALQHLDHAQALLIVCEGGVEAFSHGALTGVTERRMSEVVSESDRLGQVLIQAQSTRQRTRDLGNLKGMCQASAVMVASGGKKDLCFIHQAAERLAMDDAVAVALIFGTVIAARQGNIAPTAIDIFCCVGGKKAVRKGCVALE